MVRYNTIDTQGMGTDIFLAFGGDGWHYTRLFYEEAMSVMIADFVV